MRRPVGPGALSRPVGATILVVFLAILACGVPVEIAPLPVDETGFDEQVGEAAEALETLAPLPTVAISDESMPVQGESIDVGGVRWTLLQAAELGQQLESESDVVDDLEASGRLIGVRFRVENLGELPLTFVGMEVFDAEGAIYAYLPAALAFIVEDEACEVELLEPSATVTCTALYDVASDATGLRGVLTDLNLLGGDEEWVELKLE